MRYYEIIAESRNIINPEEIDSFLHQQLQYKNISSNSNIYQYFSRNVKKYLISKYEGSEFKDITASIREPGWPSRSGIDVKSWVNRAYKRGDKLVIFKPNEQGQLQSRLDHLIDWLRNLENTNDPLFNRLDRLSVPEAFERARQWTFDLTHAATKISKEQEKQAEKVGAKIILKLPNGFYWLQLFDPDCLSIEGRKMGHCVGAYSGQIFSMEYNIYSLRDKKNDARLTAQVKFNISSGNQRNGKLVQLKGKGNEGPSHKYADVVFQFLNHENFSIADSAHYDLSRILALPEYELIDRVLTKLATE